MHLVRGHSVDDAAVVFVVTAAFERRPLNTKTGAKDGLMEAGEVAQNITLMAASMD